ncbi:ATP-dependent RNA helicase TDRD9 [Araneus ventricosus]|uniref:ATP-dependent RNA helicase TDRD9 n=1 Tax=Araneus ventricosus TaxID=182803 RepID=A0A4Y2D996_ARAVE|nr:ATP-dependent RNA helicase TDRD9 [Araneus ventricosus]
MSALLNVLVCLCHVLLHLNPATVLFVHLWTFGTDRAQKSYIGALCGLGYDPITKESLYPDHDIELAFDIELNIEDIREINAIRMGFNLLLHSDCDALQYQTNPVSVVHEQTRKTIINLLRKKRTPLEPKYYHKPGQWNQIPDDGFLYAEVEARADCADVLPLHRVACLATYGADGLTEHVNDLYKMVENGTSKEFQLIRCKLCSVDVQSTRELILHLDSDKHVQNELLNGLNKRQ